MPISRNLAAIASGTYLAVLTAAGSAGAGVIVSPVSATASNTTSGFGIEKTIDQSGLSTGFTSGVTDFDTYIGSGPSHTLSASQEWFGEEGTSSATVVYDLGSSLTIDALALWNEESSGFGTGVVSVSDDDITYAALTTINPFDNPFADYTAQVFTFAATAFQFFKMELSGCPQPNPGSYQSCAIGEVAFRVADDVTAPIPVPAALPLLAGGVALLGGLRLRTRKSTTI